MTGSRVFAAVTADDLRRWSVGEPVDLTDRPAHAVTDRARQASPDDDEEELEYAAQWSAVERAQPGAGPVVVAALDVPVGPKEGWTDVARFSALGSPAVNFGPGDPNVAHMDDEWCPEDQIVDALEALTGWLA